VEHSSWKLERSVRRHGMFGVYFERLSRVDFESFKEKTTRLFEKKLEHSKMKKMDIKKIHFIVFC